MAARPFGRATNYGETAEIFCLYVNFSRCRAEMDIVRSNIDVLVSTGLGPRAQDDFLLARDTCVALLKLSQSRKVRLVTKLDTPKSDYGERNGTEWLF